jgi:hypothetical protein
MAECAFFYSWLPSNVTIECVPIAPMSESGTCLFKRRPLEVPVPVDTTGTLDFLQPDDGAVLDPAEDVTFAYTGSNEATFLFVTKQTFFDAAELAAGAIWGAVSPKSPPSSEARTVRWSQGHAIVNGVWQPDAGTPPPDTDLFAAVYAVDGDHIVAANDQLLSFRVGTGWPLPGDACDGPDTGMASTSNGACANPTMVLTCARGACVQLCLTTIDCPTGTGCGYDSDLGLLYCQ